MHTEFQKLISNKIKFSLFLLKNLPAAYFSGVRIHTINQASCVVTVPYKWFSRNPFNSTYFACLAMAAEMSTGVLAMGNIWKRTPKVSMLVVDIKGNFHKKATDLATFTCNDGAAVEAAVAQTIATGESVTITMQSNGYNKANELVAEFAITWSFKAKKA